MQEAIDSLKAEYGTVPPPWVLYNEHPLSMCWRMGAGESHIMLWSEWWSEQPLTEEQKIEYFRLWPPPHCWLPFLIEAIWDVEGSGQKKKLGPYFERTNTLGFGSRNDYERDVEDPKWSVAES